MPKGSKKHHFMSKQQVRWAFATHQKFARRWAHNTGMHSAITKRLGRSPAYRKLPRYKKGRRH